MRVVNPFISSSYPTHFVDGVGLIPEPNAEVRFADWIDDNFVVSRANSQGFVDREPVSAERAADGCHIAFIGDSYVEAKEVSIADKFHAQLEEMAARELPHLGITTQAYGIRATGQINQLPFYDEYARRLNPKLVVLVFFLNDFTDNSTALKSLDSGMDPDRLPYMSAQRDERGVLKLRPPDPEYRRFQLPRLPKPWYSKAWRLVRRVSYFSKWMHIKIPAVMDRVNAILANENSSLTNENAWRNILAEHPCCALLLDDWQPVIQAGYLYDPFLEKHLPPVFEEALEYTAFGMEQFKRRTDRDGAALGYLVGGATYENAGLSSVRPLERHCRGARHSLNRPLRLHLQAGALHRGCPMASRRPLERRRTPMGGGSGFGMAEGESGCVRLSAAWRHCIACRKSLSYAALPKVYLICLRMRLMLFKSENYDARFYSD